MKLTLGFSPCPNDTFLFHALTHKLIDTKGLDFEVILADVEALNLMALEGKLDFTKLSYAAFARAIDKYVLLHAGSALGHACGPMLIAKNPVELNGVPGLKIAIPGHHTTANFLLSLAFPNATNKVELVFDEIEDAVLKGEVDAGLIIHENRFTYQSKGLHKIIDLGQWWEEQEKVPIPLGGICAKRNLDPDLIKNVDKLIRKSVEYAFENPDASNSYVAQHAQEMDPAVRRAHIKLYVNNYTADLGTLGLQAVNRMFELGAKQGLVPVNTKNLFI